MSMTLKVEHRVCDGIWLVPDFAQTILGIDPQAYLAGLLRDYPQRGSNDAITPFAPQWIEGDNPALHYRGNALKRGKMWFQRGDPHDGVRRYNYTGWQWRVSEATSDVSQCPHTRSVADAYDQWAAEGGNPPANHYIVTKYLGGADSIGFHFDKPADISPGSLITVVKLGNQGRPFQIRRVGEVMPFFDRVLPPGSALVMTLEANLKTQHSVPVVVSSQLTGSIVFRSIQTIIPVATVRKKLIQSERTRDACANRKRKRTAHVCDPVLVSLLGAVQSSHVGFSEWQVGVFRCFRKFALGCVGEWEGSSLVEKLRSAGVTTLTDFLETVAVDFGDEMLQVVSTDELPPPTTGDLLTLIDAIAQRAWGTGGGAAAGGAQ